jgi:hypothetical protein
VRISFPSTNTIHDLTKSKTNRRIQEHKKYGIYKLTYDTCKLSYVGQTGLDLNQRYQEHIRHIKQHDPQSAYALQILNNNYKHGNINTKMSLLKQITQTSQLISYEQFYIQSHYYHRELIPQQNTGENNPMNQLIFNPRITSIPAIYTDQYCYTLPNS